MSEDINHQILSELQKLQKAARRNLIFSMAFAIIAGGAFACFVYSKENTPWRRISRAVDQGDYAKAIKLTRSLEEMNPKDSYTHSYLGWLYLKLNDHDHAKSEYEIAYKLWPSDDYKKQIDTIKKLELNNKSAEN